MKPKQLVQRPSRHAPPDHDISNLSERPSDSVALRPSSTNTATGAAQLQSRANGAHWEPKFPFDLVVAYENEATRDRAFTLCDHLVMKLQDDYDIQQSWWKFPFLYEPQLLKRATDVAAAADMIIISLNHGTELPLIARTWIEGWLRQKDGHGSALVALVDNTPSLRCADSPLIRHLKGVAQKSGMDFFPHVFAAAPLPAESLYQEAPARETGLMPLLQGILRRPNNAQPWGINEY